MLDRTTGEKRNRLELTPPFLSENLLEIVCRDLASSEEETQLAQVLYEKRLPPLVNTKVLAFILGISHQLLYAMVHAPSRYYRTFTISKKDGREREIATPRVFLKVVQRWILSNVLYRKHLPSYVTGFVPRRGLLHNASFHVGHKYLLKVDLRNFFPSVRYERVAAVYGDIGFSPSVVSVLAGLCVLGGRLPQGAPTSPYLANIAFLPQDVELKALCDVNAVSYSRYADDLTFSSSTKLGQDFLDQVLGVIERGNFRANAEKIRMAGPGQRLMTVGMVVNEKIHPPRKLRRQLRARFYQASNNPEAFAQQGHSLQGWAAYVNMYDRELGKQYLSVAQKVVGRGTD